ncbi:DUF1684 domain-containing protein [Xanthomonas hyacinthi]|uniref:DUF1684 domain-containing protein n=1 Tax=Xanthomonas hyacinthi TaxID=56455 RepID=A0A2S7ERS8_9XANT|nr:DUF1684 domain-containing protein [Xanthomonas hyacinthi]PPU95814.1 hypothetical protein XhyaCFBP1156_17510 [Xanthomonas hyacinthi]QGY75334.1 DUF1684 domain-containing protein [Xanthomonas hyacinthi]
MRWRGMWMLTAALSLSACGERPRAAGADASPRAQSEAHYRMAVEQRRAQRVARLRAPSGWLSYTGSGRLRSGVHQVGSAAGNDVRLPAGPAHLGSVRVDADAGVLFEAAAGAVPTVHGQPFRAGRLGTDAAHGSETRLALGEQEFYVVRSGTLFGWRFRDPHAAARDSFRGIDYFPIDPRWRVVADWQPLPAPRAIMLLTSIGTPQPLTLEGSAEFTLDGRRYRLQALRDDDGKRLFFPFSDRSSGRESYGGARYLFVEPAQGERIVLDFNLAQNPPCAFTVHVVCPLAPVGNRLELAVTAGEKNYVGAR